MKSDYPDANWWSFCIDGNERREKVKEDISLHTVEVNPTLADGRQLLDYHTYLGLDKLLQCQRPSSKIPDERIFIVVHQFCELLFKQMIFDIAVVAKTFEALLRTDDALFLRSIDERNDQEFWRSALSASARIEFGSNKVLPLFLEYLKRRDADGTQMFSNEDFLIFREFLGAASGFQTAQYRLIQRAFGKSNLLNVRLFPSMTYRKSYEGEHESGLVAVVDKLILGNGANVATPPSNSPYAIVACLDNIAHDVLNRLCLLKKNESWKSDAERKEISPIRLEKDLADSETAQPEKDKSEHVKNASLALRRILAKPRGGQKKAADLFASYVGDTDKQILSSILTDHEREDVETVLSFLSDLMEAVEKENKRRQKLKEAREGAYRLREIPESNLAIVLNSLVLASNHLDKENFLSPHKDIASSHLGQEGGGSGGGGIPYLGYSLTYLIPLFPGLIGYQVDL